MLVCNLDGRILILATAPAPSWAHGPPSPVVGMGRSGMLTSTLDRGLIHALHTIGQRLWEHGRAGGARWHPSPLGPMAARADDPRPDPADEQDRALSGLCALAGRCDASFAQGIGGDSVLHSLTEGNRASLAAMRSAVQQLRQQAGDGPLPEQLAPRWCKKKWAAWASALIAWPPARGPGAAGVGHCRRCRGEFWRRPSTTWPSACPALGDCPGP